MRAIIYSTESVSAIDSNEYEYSYGLPASVNHSVIDSLLNYLKSDLNIYKVYVDEQFRYANQKITVSHIKLRGQPIESRSIIAFYTQSDTLSTSLISIAGCLPSEAYKIFIPLRDIESAQKPLIKAGINFEVISTKKLIKHKITTLVTFNDWAKIPKGLIHFCRLNKISTFCVQESVINFGDSKRRMTHADYVITQGLQSSKHLKRPHNIILGNPRYSNYSQSLMKPKAVLINLNFTYGVEEEFKGLWLKQVIAALGQVNLQFYIIQHPRDQTDLSKYKNVIKSNSSTINEILSKGNILISRFSSLIHESLLKGLKCIYFNPHKEKLFYDFTPDQNTLFYCEDQSELKKLIYLANNTDQNHSNLTQSYMELHCIQTGQKAAKEISILLLNSFKPNKAKFKDYLFSYLYNYKFISYWFEFKNNLKY